MTVKPKAVSDLTLVFPGDVTELIVPMKFIPVKFQSRDEPWVKLAHTWFYEGLKGRVVPKEGIDLVTALRHIRVIMGAFEPQHEHKIACVAYLMDQWFEKFIPNETV